MQKVLLITGASSDVGMNLIRKIYSDYEVIYAQYHRMNEEFGQLISEIKGKGNIIPLEADFRNSEEVSAMIQRIKDEGDIPNHIVHLPAPKAYNKQFHKDDWDNYEAAWEISVHSIVTILKAFMPVMAKAGYGRVVFMLSSVTRNQPPKFQSCYVTIKYALLGLMKSLSAEYMSKGITVNGISPDMMETKFLSELPHLIIEQNAENSPLGRNVYVEEILPVIAYLLSDAGAAMTGENIAITGGL
ncbi:MAG: SDR family oxidoreductase [Lachnospiraceae bacterium]|nr:SDR family oxidoreductase [Lachnospiraceae bacterium]